MQPVRGVGVEPTLSGSQGRRITAFLPPERVDRRGIAPRSLPCDGSVFLLDEQPQKRSGRGSNPVFRAYQGGVRPQHFQTFELRRPDLNRRRTAYETVLATRLQSTPQSVPPAGLEPAILSV